MCSSTRVSWRLSSFLSHKTRVLLTSDTKVIYRRYASLFFITSITPSDNELITLEIIHRYVEVLDRYFGNVSGIVPGEF